MNAEVLMRIFFLKQKDYFYSKDLNVLWKTFKLKPAQTCLKIGVGDFHLVFDTQSFMYNFL